MIPGGLAEVTIAWRVAGVGAWEGKSPDQLPAPVDLRIFDLSGRLVRTLLSGSQPAGTHRVLWDGRDGDGRDAPSGVYLYRLVTEEGAQSGKAALLK